MTETATSIPDHNADGHDGDVAHGSYEGPTESIEALGGPSASTANSSSARSSPTLRSGAHHRKPPEGDIRGFFRPIATPDNDDKTSAKNEEKSSPLLAHATGGSQGGS